MNLIDLGWNDFFAQDFEKYESRGFIPFRVNQEHKELYMLLGECGELRGEVTGKFRFNATSRANYPAVGDWVVATPYDSEGKAIIHAVLNRRSYFSRRAVLSGGMPETGGETDEQVLAANIDTVFLVNALDNDFSIRRIERYLSAAWDSGASPVIVLNKADLCDEIDEKIAGVEAVAMGVPIHAISAADNRGFEQLGSYLDRGQTVVLLGSSGVGKSTMINSLLGEERLKTGSVREYDGKGRHTTTYRELLLLPGGAIIIDTPGMKLLKIWDGEESISQIFSDIEELIAQCKFADCRHENEPGCAVRAAIESGKLDSERLENYLKLQKEQKFLASRKNQREARKQQRDRGKYYKRVLNEQADLRKKRLI